MSMYFLTLNINTYNWSKKCHYLNPMDLCNVFHDAKLFLPIPVGEK